ncbi:MAG: hypothetical protein H0U57_12000 [Tatlockia sp.]|nr:hypothetical protein [Tatlockia sp.]
MKISFFVSSLGDSDLALKNIQSLNLNGQHETVIISLTKAAQQRVESVQSSSLITKITLPDILQLNSDLFPEGTLNAQQLDTIGQYVQGQKITYAYFGVPSVNNEIPFQLAESLDIPLLMAYEFMFKPDSHCLWKHIPTLSKKSNVNWALPLASAKEDFPVTDERVFITGHLSIDNAYSANLASTKNTQEVKETLKVSLDKSLTFISSTTQPVEVDASFLDCLLTELKQHPNMQVRLGLHPGIQNFDAYLQEILSIYRKHPEIAAQFKIILPDNLIGRIEAPELTIDEPMFKNAFLRVNINGSEAASASERITQAVPGALLNQAGGQTSIFTFR